MLSLGQGILTERTLSLRPPHPPGKPAEQKFTGPVTTYEQPVQFSPDHTLTLGVSESRRAYEAPPGATGLKQPLPLKVLSTCEPESQCRRMRTPPGGGGVAHVVPV
jgi:hypothetical protein